MDKEQEKAKLKELIGGKPSIEHWHWWDEHRNWALWLSGGGNLWYLPLALILSLTDTDFTSDSFYVIAIAVITLLWLFSFYVTWWYLKQKNRSLKYIFVAFIPLGIWWLLSLTDW